MVAMLTMGCKYAIKSLLFISRQGGTVSVKEVSTAIESPPAFTSKILQQLALAGIIRSVKGQGGGFIIDDESKRETKILTIIRAIEGDAIATSCFLGVNHCSDEHPCPLHHLYAPIREQLNRKLFNISLFDILQNNELHDLAEIK